MHNKYKIAISLSFALTLFTVLPWISIFEQTQGLRAFVSPEKVQGRLPFLAISVFISCLLFFQYNFFWKNQWIGFQTFWLRNLANVLVNILLAVLISLILISIGVRIFGIEMTKSFFLIYLFRNLGIAFVAVLVTYAYEVAERSELDRIQLLTLHNEKTETELAALKTQIDPHFLFNSLNSLTGLIRENQKEAIHFVNHLSETFRYTVDNPYTHLIPLKEELHFLESYLYMMRVRFGNGLDCKIDIQSEHLEKKLPQFALQLLVENAVKHNIVSVKRPLTVTILSDENQLSITNNLQLKRQPMRSYGIGLVNLKKRYELLGHESVIITKTEKEFQVKLLLL